MHIISSLSHNYILTLTFASILLVILVASTNEVLGHGVHSPSSCYNRYDATWVSYVISNGTHSFDAVKDSNAYLEVNRFSSFSIAEIMHTAPSSSQGNTELGSLWFRTNYNGFGYGYCSSSNIGPEQDIVTYTHGNREGQNYRPGGQQITFDTVGNGVVYGINWMPVPSAPISLTAMASSSQIDLSWNSGYSWGYDSTNYKIYRSTSSGTEKYLATVGNTLFYNDTNVTNGVTYFYTVTGVNSYGEGMPSTEVSATTQPNTKPDFAISASDLTLIVPAGGSAETEITLSSVNGFDGIVTLSHSAPSALSVTISNSTVRVPAGGSASTTLSISAPSSDSSTDHTFRITATNGSLTRSTGMTVSVLTVPFSPSYLSARGISTSQISLNWIPPTNAPVTGYQIERSDNGVVWFVIASNTNSASTTYSDSGLESHTTYHYRVSAINQLGTSSPSMVAKGTTLFPLLVITSQDANGSSLIGFNATIFQIETKVASGPTPLTFRTTNSLPYEVTLADDQYYEFDHWLDNGSTDRNRQVSITSDTTLTGVYKKVSSNLTVKSVDVNNNTINGYHVKLYQNGEQINSGNTPVTFLVRAGQNYMIEPHDSIPYRFDHWLDTGNTERSRTITPSIDDLSVTAVFSNQPASGNDISYGLVGEWKFENTVLDTSQNGNDGTVRGQEEYVPGKIGYSFLYDGSTSVYIPESPSLNFGEESFSIALWIKTTSSEKDWLVSHIYICPESWVCGGYSIELDQGRVVTTVKGYRSSWDVPVRVTSTNLVNDNQYHLIEWVVDRSTQTSKLYVDTELQDTADVSAVSNLDSPPQYSVKDDLYLGGTGNHASPPTTSYYSGIIDQVRFWNRPLTSTEITSLYDENVSDPTTVPSSPGNLQAAAVSSSQIDLSWTAPSNNGGTPIIGYQIERSTDNGSTWTVLVSNTGSVSTEYKDTGLASNTTYTYRVFATNEIGTGPPSNTASATTFDILPTSFTINVNSVDKLGNTLEGIWIQLASADGTIIDEGFTPITFDVIQGGQYTVLANNYNQHQFLHWEDGNTDSNRDVTPTADINMTATYTITTADQLLP